MFHHYTFCQLFVDISHVRVTGAVVNFHQFSPVFTSFYQFLPVFTSHWVILPPFVLYLRPYEIETLSAVNMLLFLWCNRIHIELFLNIQSMEPQGSYIRAGEPIACWGGGGTH